MPKISAREVWHRRGWVTWGPSPVTSQRDRKEKKKKKKKKKEEMRDGPLIPTSGRTEPTDVNIMIQLFRPIPSLISKKEGGGGRVWFYVTIKP